jgi:protein TonB
MHRVLVVSLAALVALPFASGCGATDTEAPAPRVPAVIAPPPAKRPIPPVLAEPVQPEKAAAAEAPESPEPHAVEQEPVDPNGGVPAGVMGGVPGGIMGGVPGGPIGSAPAMAPSVVAGIPGVIPFGLGMNQPRKLSGRDVDYTKEAVAAGVAGLMLVKCVITTAGALTGCRIIKGLPHLDAAVLAALKTQKYEPVLFRGKAVNVDKLFVFRFKLPAAPPPPPSTQPKEAIPSSLP